MARPAALLGVPLVAAVLTLAPAAAAQRTPATPAGFYQEEFLTAVRRNLATLRVCYDAAQPEGDAAWQRLRTVTVVINRDGTIGSITPNPGPGAPGIEACMHPIFERLHLSPPSDGTPITLTYTRVQLERAMQPPGAARSPRPRRGGTPPRR